MRQNVLDEFFAVPAFTQNAGTLKWVLFCRGIPLKVKIVKEADYSPVLCVAAIDRRLPAHGRFDRNRMADKDWGGGELRQECPRGLARQ